MRMEDEPQGTVCRLVTPCTWGFQEIVLGGTPAAELRGIEAEGVSERDERDPRRRWGSHERRRRRGAQEDEAAPKVVTQGEPARKRYVFSVFSVFSLSLSLSIYLSPLLFVHPQSQTDASRALPLGTIGNEKAKGRGGGVQRVSWLRGQD